MRRWSSGRNGPKGLILSRRPMPKLILVDSREIEISDRQWEALESVFNQLDNDRIITINKQDVRKGDILGLDVDTLPVNPMNPKPKFAIQRTITKLPSDETIPQRIRDLHARGYNVDWFFRRKK